ncbi:MULTISPECIES: amidohydrolase family protein [Alteromonadaceae]|uniref:amidohydrolase family protein n=1 Tax=Alteromonadaceae TaxID=72275 RepID=UPI001C0A08B3|nr:MULTISPECIES: amidohydrolase family protein [Aliiglaciecola]MBU2877900.1 amidohydrolase family protein [Aliiglaciecola lipolytica]MDO6709264.1 amidohydrolase family protein [Aliiglaciecola sp. 2_MG-2023]MDO6750412.1 amidohydrolase family protein [Aliiglaciecola sp. 1_MG-2023]
MRIDSHQHFWQRELGHYNWLTEDLGAIYRDFLPEDLRPHLKKSGIDKTVLIQAAPDMDETKYMLSLAHSTDFIAGVVGWVDMQHVDAPYHIARLSKDPYFKGIRPMIQDIVDDDWMLKPELNPAFVALMKLNLSFDALVKPRHLKQLLTLVDRYPNLKIAIDHAAKPNIAEAQFSQWAADIKELAKRPNVYCKLSGLVTEAGNNPNFDILVPYMRHLFECFGASRLMWGSDWPVLNLATDYTEWVALTEAFLATLTNEQQVQIWSKTASKFYRLQYLD